MSYFFREKMAGWNTKLRLEWILTVLRPKNENKLSLFSNPLLTYPPPPTATLQRKIIDYFAFDYAVFHKNPSVVCFFLWSGNIYETTENSLNSYYFLTIGRSVIVFWRFEPDHSTIMSKFQLQRPIKKKNLVPVTLLRFLLHGINTIIIVFFF